MGEIIAFVGFIGVTACALIARLRRHPLPFGVGLLALLAGMSACAEPGDPTAARADSLIEQTRATLHSYIGTYAAVEAASVSDYEPTSDRSHVVVRTTLAAVPESLAASQRICELARNVIVEVRVQADDGTSLWSCDRVKTRGNPQIEAAAEQKAAAKAEADRLAQEQAAAEQQAQLAAAQQRTRQQAAARAIAEAAAARRAQQASRASQALPAGGDCHASYAGECLPVNASDVDCAGGDGNGPVYSKTNNIQVVGPDEYGLDADGDGMGCDADQQPEQQIPPASDPATPADTTASEPPPAGNCHPSYSGECLPADASDVDCAGGSGNGPVYAQTKNIQIVGPDEYGLDADGDGMGCDV